MEKKGWKDRLLVENEHTREYFEKFIEKEIKQAETKAFRDGLETASRLAKASMEFIKESSDIMDLEQGGKGFEYLPEDSYTKKLYRSLSKLLKR
jgi:hypothetical protein